MTHQETMTDYILSLIEGFVAAGIKKAVISPGSRSTPVSLLIHRDARIDTQIAIDERSAAFLALGLAKVDLEPVLLVCTSGTAAANYYPAICEAKASQIPLVVLTTDRPPELRDVGAPQAMNQQDLYGKQVKGFTELSVPENTPNMLQYVQFQASQQTRLAKAAPKGPVHLNVPLREPLLPDFSRTVTTTTQIISEPKIDRTSHQDWEAYFSKKGIIVVGEERTVEEAQQLLHLADALGWPIVGDPLTNLANAGVESSIYIRHADLIFSAGVSVDFQPEVVLRFGRLPVTKSVMQWLMALPTETIWLFVDEGQQWHDQLQNAQVFLPYRVTDFVQASLPVATLATPTWTKQWQTRQAQAADQIATLAGLATLNETSAVYEAHRLLVEEEQLFVSNSNAIRLLDRYIQMKPKQAKVFGNRGVNGIDGITSTAVGVAMSGPTTLITGDLAFFHDMNGLQLAKALNVPLTILLLNNNGGGIFSFLSQRTLDKADFDPLFATPTDLDFEKVAALYQMPYHVPDTLEALRDVLSQTTTGPRIIEVKGQFADPVTLWEDLVAEFKEVVADE